MNIRMNKILLATLLLLSCLGLSNCSDDAPKGASIFPTTPVQRNAFDNWLLKNYTNPYNIEFKYRLEDAETDYNYHLCPPTPQNGKIGDTDQIPLVRCLTRKWPV